MLFRLRRFAGPRLVYLAAALVIAGCSLSTDAPAAQTGAINDGDGQTAPAGTALPTPLSVIVVDQYGFVIENVRVTWDIRSGGGSLSATDTRTNADGVSSVVYTAGPTAGTAVITADIAGVGVLNFTETIS